MIKIRAQIFVSFVILISIVLYFFVDWILSDVKPHYRESTEDSLADTSFLFASMASTHTKKGVIDVSTFREAFADIRKRPLTVQIYNFLKTNVDLRVYITNKVGLVIFDSDNGRDEGKDYSQWRDVKLTLTGQYGARTSRDDPALPNQSILYVAAPIIADGELVGVISVAKPTQNANLLIKSAEKKITEGSIVVFVILFILGLFLSLRLTRPIDQLTDYALAIRDGKRAALPNLGKSEIGKLGQAFEEMRQTLEGKKYIEKYVQTLTHEIKSPLSGIRAGAELLQGNLPPEEEKRFLSNILNDSNRIQTLIEKMLLLSSLQTKQGLDEKSLFSVSDFVLELKSSLEAQVREKQITLKTDSGTPGITLAGDKFLIKQAMINLLQNAIEFSKQGSEIQLKVQSDGKQVGFIVEDLGSGIPDYALPRIFESFYSLARTDTGRKSSGLGLTLVKEVAELHGGSIEITSKCPGGTRATLSLPIVP